MSLRSFISFCIVVWVITGQSAVRGQAVPPSLIQNPPNGETVKPAAPVADKDGVYAVGEGVAPPGLTHAAFPLWPQDGPPELDRPVICLLAAVIGIDGLPGQVKVVRGCQDAFQASAIESVQKSTFEPGKVGDNPVPVLVHLRVSYRSPLMMSGPQLALRYREGFGGGSPQKKRWDTPPKVIHQVDAEFSEEARRNGKEGVVLVSLTVDEEGNPRDVHVVRGAGSGLDEQALKAVNQYRFQPATLDGKPVASPISVEVSFRLYSRRRN